MAKEKQLQRFAGVCAGSSRKCRRCGKYLAFSVFMCERRRRTVPAGVSGAGGDIWICTSDDGCGDRQKNEGECVAGVWNVASEVEVCRIPDVSGSDVNYDVLFGHRRMDHEIFL